MTGHASPLASVNRTSGMFQTQSSGEVNAMGTIEQSPGCTRLLRLLVPINANADSRWGIEYALRLHRKGRPVEVVLLNVGEPITQWQVLRFLTAKEASEFQSARAQSFIDDASLTLLAQDVPCRGIFKQGDIVFSILDTAEELDCDEIVMPEPARGVLALFSTRIATKVARARRDIPVVLVNDEGETALRGGP